jgi:hypothetical protein
MKPGLHLAALLAAILLSLHPAGEAFAAALPATTVTPETLTPGEPRTLDAGSAVAARVRESYGQLPLAFEGNRGQSDAAVRFLARGPGYSLFLTPTLAVVELSRRPPVGAPNDARRGALPPQVVRMTLRGANPRSQMAGLDPLPGRSHSFVGNDPRRWLTGLVSYRRVVVRDVYPGIDLVYYGQQRQLEYDLVLAPGADPKRIRIAIEGAQGLTVDAAGDLLVRLADGALTLKRPVAYQEIAGLRRSVAARYVRHRQELVLALGDFDPHRQLVIDPVVSYATYLGGKQIDSGGGIAVDRAGNAYVTGSTLSTDFPTKHAVDPTFGGGGSDAFITKLNAAGTAIIYSTFLGGDGFEAGDGIAVDGAGNAYIIGTTYSSNFPTVHALQPHRDPASLYDVFVAKLNASGSALLYSTHLGGSGVYTGGAIAVDAAGNAYVTGTTAEQLTEPRRFPLVNPLQAVNRGTLVGLNAFVAKLNPAGSALVYSTYLGGNDQRATSQGQAHSPDTPFGIAVDSAGNAVVTGTTISDNFPLVNPLQASAPGFITSFVSKFNAAGSALIYSTYLGGSNGTPLFALSGQPPGDTEAHGVAVDQAGNAYVTGFTTDRDFPRLAALQPAFGGGGADAFVTKINASGALVFSTYLGGNDLDQGNGIAVDASGRVLVSGLTKSTNFPTVQALQTVNHGTLAFVSELDPSGATLRFSTYLGSTTFGSSAVAVAVDGSGGVYLTGSTGSGFPVVAAEQPTYGGESSDAFVAKLVLPCQSSATTLCLNGGRFAVSATYSTGTQAGPAQVVPLTTDTGYLWFFSSSNVEAVIKVLDGCALDGHYWVFAGGLTNVNVVLNVTDTESGALKTYTNPLNTTYQPIQDTGAFACGKAAADAAAAPNEARELAIVRPPEAFSTALPEALPGCTAGATTLCLGNNRFAVQATFDSGQQSGQAQAVPLTGDTGYLWFFSASNVEAVVKILNGCGLGGHYWVFAGGLTNVKVVLTVTDTQTNAVQTYTNPQSTTFQPIQDTKAFSTCP